MVKAEGQFPGAPWSHRTSLTKHTFKNESIENLEMVSAKH